jgi:hypothetical protein
MPRYRDLLEEHTVRVPHISVALIIASTVAAMNVLTALLMLADAG